MVYGCAATFADVLRSGLMNKILGRFVTNISTAQDREKNASSTISSRSCAVFAALSLILQKRSIHALYLLSFAWALPL